MKNNKKQMYSTTENEVNKKCLGQNKFNFKTDIQKIHEKRFERVA